MFRFVIIASITLFASLSHADPLLGDKIYDRCLSLKVQVSKLRSLESLALHNRNYCLDFTRNILSGGDGTMETTELPPPPPGPKSYYTHDYDDEVDGYNSDQLTEKEKKENEAEIKKLMEEDRQAQQNIYNAQILQREIEKKLKKDVKVIINQAVKEASQKEIDIELAKEKKRPKDKKVGANFITKTIKESFRKSLINKNKNYLLPNLYKKDELALSKTDPDPHTSYSDLDSKRIADQTELNKFNELKSDKTVTLDMSEKKVVSLFKWPGMNWSNCRTLPGQPKPKMCDSSGWPTSGPETEMEIDGEPKRVTYYNSLKDKFVEDYFYKVKTLKYRNINGGITKKSNLWVRSENIKRFGEKNSDQSYEHKDKDKNCLPSEIAKNANNVKNAVQNEILRSPKIGACVKNGDLRGYWEKLAPDPKNKKYKPGGTKNSKYLEDKKAYEKKYAIDILARTLLGEMRDCHMSTGGDHYTKAIAKVMFNRVLHVKKGVKENEDVHTIAKHTHNDLVGVTNYGLKKLRKIKRKKLLKLSKTQLRKLIGKKGYNRIKNLSKSDLQHWKEHQSTRNYKKGYGHEHSEKHKNSLTNPSGKLNYANANFLQLLPEIMLSYKQFSTFNKGDSNRKLVICPEKRAKGLDLKAWKQIKKLAVNIIMEPKKFVAETKNIQRIDYTSNVGFHGYPPVNMKYVKVNGVSLTKKRCLRLWKSPHHKPIRSTDWKNIDLTTYDFKS